MVSGVNLISIACQLEGHNGDVTCMDWDKNKLYSGSKDQHVVEWDIQTGESTR